jgi:hypothetical protein
MPLEGLLERLKMEHLYCQLDSLCEQAAKRDLGYREFLTEALRAEWNGRHHRAVESRLKSARFPSIKTLEQVRLPTARSSGSWPHWPLWGAPRMCFFWALLGWARPTWPLPWG